MNVPRPGLHRLAPASRGSELNMLFHRRNKQVVAERTHVLAFPEHFMGGRYHHDCQSALKFDPVSASNFDPFDRRVLAVALVSSELAGIAETRRAPGSGSASRLLKSQLSLPVSTMSQWRVRRAS